MITKNKYNIYFYTLLSILVVMLLFVSNTLSISYKEALNVFVNTSVLSYITNISIYLFGQNDIALRIPFIFFYILSSILMYLLTQGYFKYEKDRLISISIFMLLPGVLSASILVNSAIIVTFCTLLYIYLYERRNKHCYSLLIIFLFIDNSFAILFLALFFFSLKDKDKDNKLLIVSLILFALSMYIYGFTTNGKPKGFLVDTFAIYASIFSPLLFIYFFYTIYRASLKKNRSLIWYISITALLVSIIFSFRQRVYIEDFAPYVVIFLPFMLKTFFHSYRIRLKVFRKKHDIAVMLVLTMLLINVFFTMFNKPLYIFLSDPKKHFVYNYHFVKELSQKLKQRNIYFINCKDKRLALRLKFYGIQEGKQYYFTSNKKNRNSEKIAVTYYGKELLSLYINKN